jgi:hypothetical protein
MRSCLVEVRYIRIEDALELPLMKEQQVVKAFLPHTPGEALTDCIRSGSVIRGLEDFNCSRRHHSGLAQIKPSSKNASGSQNDLE